MGTLYLVGAPAGDPGDLTLRAVRVLKEVALVAADRTDWAQRLLNHHGLAAPLVAVSAGGGLLNILNTADVAVLLEGWSLFPSALACELVQTAIRRGFPVVPIPGPALAVTALVMSGQPASTFIYLGGLPRERTTRRDLLARVASERRTLVVQASPGHLPRALADLRQVLGDRPLVVVTLSEQGIAVVWRGMLDEASGQAWTETACESFVLIVGESQGAAHWDEERLRAEIRACLERGLGAREIGRQLALQSGWPRREVYRLAVNLARAAAGRELS